jgi:peptidyl-dipeptidase A
MTHWEADIYAHQLEPDDWNDRWWKYVSEFQGVEPPGKRGEKWADYATKTHINDTPAYYYNYAFATVLKFQLHDYIARKISHRHRNVNTPGTRKSGNGFMASWRREARRTGAKCSRKRPAKIFRPARWWNISNR